MAKEEMYKSKIDNIHMKVMKDDTGSKIIKVEHANGNKQVEQGTYDELKLSYDGQKKRFDIDFIPDNTTMETHASPGCFWNFFGGEWYRICL